MTYIGDIAYIPHPVIKMHQVPVEQVECHSRTGMAQVRLAVDRRTADIHAHFTGNYRVERFDISRKGIVKF